MPKVFYKKIDKLSSQNGSIVRDVKSLTGGLAIRPQGQIPETLDRMDVHLKSEGVNFRSLHENIDTSTPAGRLTFHLFSALSEFESSLNRQRTRAGLEAARARGRVGGRPKALKRQTGANYLPL